MRRLVTLGALALLVACRSGPSLPPPSASALAGTRVAVLPFRVNGELDEVGRFKPSASEQDVSETLGERIARRLAADLDANNARVVAPDEVFRATPPVGAAIYDADLAARVGARVGATHAVYGAIHRYREREGSTVGVEKPASVAYRAVLVRTDTRMQVSVYHLDYTQRPLSEDLTAELPHYLQGRLGWRTRQEILDDSLTATARKIARTIVSPPSPRR